MALFETSLAALSKVLSFSKGLLPSPHFIHLLCIANKLFGPGLCCYMTLPKPFSGHRPLINHGAQYSTMHGQSCKELMLSSVIKTYGALCTA